MFLRKKKKKEESLNKKEETLLEEEVLEDPILLVPLTKDDPIFVFTRPNGSMATYGIRSLLQYIFETGLFIEPLSQLEFSDEDLRKLEAAAIEYGVVCPDLVEMRKKGDHRRKIKNTLDANYGVDRLMSDRVAEMLEIIEGSEPRKNVERKLHRLFDEVSRFYQQLCFEPENFEFAIQCRTQYMRYLRGPDHSPTPDREGLLTKCLEFLEGLAILTMIYD